MVLDGHFRCADRFGSTRYGRLSPVVRPGDVAAVVRPGLLVPRQPHAGDRCSRCKCRGEPEADDGLGHADVVINTRIQVSQGKVEVDFDGTSSQVRGNVNCPISVTAAAVYYVFRCLLPAQAPACAGSFRPISISAAKGSLLNASYPAAVAAGNVETSTRVVDVVLGDM